MDNASDTNKFQQGIIHERKRLWCALERVLFSEAGWSNFNVAMLFKDIGIMDGVGSTTLDKRICVTCNEYNLEGKYPILVQGAWKHLACANEEDLVEWELRKEKN